MPTSSNPIKITRLPPPGPAVLSIPTSLLSSLTEPGLTPPTPPKDVPPPYLSALRVRIPVFVTEQRCSLAGELDADDARSWHWIAFDNDQPVATLRLVPVTAEVVVGGAEQEFVAMEKECVGLPDKDGRDKRSEPYHGATAMWDGREPFIKIGRMATLASHRGRGIAQRLIEESLAWAATHGADLSSPGSEGLENIPQWSGLVLSHAQKSVQEWWGKMGFEVDEGLGAWWEEGIEHVGMWRRVDATDRARGERGRITRPL
ncbi:MAG: hypothetical protein Q9178_003619 [Gyalolechia marmorata]